jgi:hypothetical protein
VSTLTATAVPGLAAVRLEAAGLPDGPATILRADVNGEGQVRLLPGQEPSGGVLIVTDYEAALTGTVTYTVDDATATTELGVPFPVLAVAGRPNLRAHLAAVTGYGEDTTTPSTVVRILDRDDPIILESPHWLPSGTLTAWCASYADARTVAAVARAGRRTMFRQPDYLGMDCYVTFTGASIAPEPSVNSDQRWTVRLDYETVATPTTDLLAAAGWDFDLLAGSFETFDDVPIAFDTFNALTVGP